MTTKPQHLKSWPQAKLWVAGMAALTAISIVWLAEFGRASTTYLVALHDQNEIARINLVAAERLANFNNDDALETSISELDNWASHIRQETLRNAHLFH